MHKGDIVQRFDEKYIGEISEPSRSRLAHVRIEMDRIYELDVGAPREAGKGLAYILKTVAEAFSPV